MKKYFEMLYNDTEQSYYKKLEEYVKNNTKKFIITANPETFEMATHNKVIENMLLNTNNDVIPDGIAIVKASKHYGINVKERITGFDTCVKLLEFANTYKKSIYLFGAKKEVLMSLIKVINKKYPHIKIVGFSDGYVEDRDKVFLTIQKRRPDICLVALGVPHQELLINKYLDNINKGIYIGVGGSFDVLSGLKKRAPEFFIKHNLEWLYRITTEPKRLKRFYQNNIKFMFKVYFSKGKNK